MMTDVLRDFKQQCHLMLRNGSCAVCGHVRDNDALLAAQGGVDTVEAGCKLADVFQFIGTTQFVFADTAFVCEDDVRTEQSLGDHILRGALVK